MNDEQLLERLRTMQETFGTVGWRLIIEEAQQEIEVIKAELTTAPTWEVVNHLQGRIVQLEQLIYLEDNIDNLVSQIEQDEEESADGDV